jgi:lipid II:glycine glycyltransferase (peptidoglycan interpeptide bridge formation enzyme)
MIDLFQSESYFRFLSETGWFQPFRFSVSHEGDCGILQGYIQGDGGLVKHFLSRRAIVNGGPYWREDSTPEEKLELLQKTIYGLKHRVIYLETRNFRDYSDDRPLFEKAGFEYEPHYDFIVDTSSEEVVETNMGKSRKRDVKTSLKNGATIIDNPTLEDVRAFYEILKDLYKTRVKTPLFPLSFFEKLYQTSFSKFILVSYNQEIVGGTVCVFDDETVYEWFACGKDGVYKNVYPSTVATYYGILFSAQSGRKRFDMMGAGAPGDGGYGVRDFKAKFGGQLVEYGRFRYVANKPLYALGKMAVKLMKKL